MKQLFLLLLLVFPLTVSAESIGRIVAVVNRDIITSIDLDMSMKSNKTKPAPTREETLNALIENRLVMQDTQTSRIDVTDADVNQAITNIIQSNGLTMGQLRQELRKQNISYSDYREGLKTEIRRAKYMNQVIGSKITISESEMYRYFQDHLASFSKSQSVHIAQIVLPFEPNMTQEDALALSKEAESIAKKAKSGRFADVAKRYSKGPFADKGGDMGDVDLKTIHAEIAAAINKMKDGEVSSPIMTPVGFHIVKVIEKQKASLDDFDALKDTINDILYEEKLDAEMKKKIAELKASAYIDIRLTPPTP